MPIFLSLSVWTPFGVLLPHPPRFWRAPFRAAGTVLLAIGLCGRVTAQTPQPPLTLQAALLEAEKRSQALQAQDAATRSARELAVAAGRLPDPMLRLSVDNLPVDGPMRFSLTQDFMTMRSVGVTQTLTREDKRRARSARFEREGDAAQAVRVMQLAALQRQTTLAWFDRHYQQQMVELLTRQRDEAALQIEATETAYRAGRGPQADVFAARSAVSRIEDRIQEARDRHASAGISLARWVGDVAAGPLGEAPRLTRIRMTESMRENGFDQIPDIALMARKEAVALAEAEVARQEKNTDWSVSFMYSQRGPAFSNMINVGVSVPLQWDQKNRQERELAAKLAKAEQVRAEREEAVRERMAQMQRWRTSWQSRLARLDDYDRGLIPLSSERTLAALSAYRGGKAPLSAVLDARRMEIDTRVERLRIEMETAALWTELEFLMPLNLLQEETR